MESRGIKSPIQKYLEPLLLQRVRMIPEKPEPLENQELLTVRASLWQRFGNIFSLFKDKELTDFD